MQQGLRSDQRRHTGYQRNSTDQEMNKHEVLKKYLEHRTKSYQSAEWWDYNLKDSMDCYVKSMLYSAVNISQSFTDFVQSKEKELNFILKKRPVVHSQIFRRNDTINKCHYAKRTVNERPIQSRTSSTELDEILQKLYPNECETKKTSVISRPADDEVECRNEIVEENEESSSSPFRDDIRETSQQVGSQQQCHQPNTLNEPSEAAINKKKEVTISSSEADKTEISLTTQKVKNSGESPSTKNIDTSKHSRVQFPLPNASPQTNELLGSGQQYNQPLFNEPSEMTTNKGTELNISSSEADASESSMTAVKVKNKVEEASAKNIGTNKLSRVQFPLPNASHHQPHTLNEPSKMTTIEDIEFNISGSEADKTESSMTALKVKNNNEEASTKNIHTNKHNRAEFPLPNAFHHQPHTLNEPSKMTTIKEIEFNISGSEANKTESSMTAVQVKNNNEEASTKNIHTHKHNLAQFPLPNAFHQQPHTLNEPSGMTTNKEIEFNISGSEADKSESSMTAVKVKNNDEKASTRNIDNNKHSHAQFPLPNAFSKTNNLIGSGQQYHQLHALIEPPNVFIKEKKKYRVSSFETERNKISMNIVKVGNSTDQASTKRVDIGKQRHDHFCLPNNIPQTNELIGSELQYSRVHILNEPPKIFHEEEEYKISSFDADSNKISLNIVKVKNNREVALTKNVDTNKHNDAEFQRNSFPEEEIIYPIPVLQKIHKIKECSVVLNRLTQEEIKRATKPIPLSMPSIADDIDNRISTVKSNSTDKFKTKNKRKIDWLFTNYESDTELTTPSVSNHSSDSEDICFEKIASILEIDCSSLFSPSREEKNEDSINSTTFPRLNSTSKEKNKDNISNSSSSKYPSHPKERNKHSVSNSSSFKYHPYSSQKNKDRINKSSSSKHKHRSKKEDKDRIRNSASSKHSSYPKEKKKDISKSSHLSSTEKEKSKHSINNPPLPEHPPSKKEKNEDCNSSLFNKRSSSKKEKNGDNIRHSSHRKYSSSKKEKTRDGISTSSFHKHPPCPKGKNEDNNLPAYTYPSSKKEKSRDRISISPFYKHPSCPKEKDGDNTSNSLSPSHPSYPKGKKEDSNSLVSTYPTKKEKSRDRVSTSPFYKNPTCPNDKDEDSTSNTLSPSHPPSPKERNEDSNSLVSTYPSTKKEKDRDRISASTLYKHPSCSKEKDKDSTSNSLSSDHPASPKERREDSNSLVSTLPSTKKEKAKNRMRISAFFKNPSHLKDKKDDKTSKTHSHKYHSSKKENYNVLKSKHKYLEKDLKKIYYGGGIVPLGKTVSPIKNNFDKIKPFFSSKERKPKDHLKELYELVFLERHCSTTDSPETQENNIKQNAQNSSEPPSCSEACDKTDSTVDFSSVGIFKTCSEANQGNANIQSQRTIVEHFFNRQSNDNDDSGSDSEKLVIDESENNRKSEHTTDSLTKKDIGETQSISKEIGSAVSVMGEVTIMDLRESCSLQNAPVGSKKRRICGDAGSEEPCLKQPKNTPF